MCQDPGDSKKGFFMDVCMEGQWEWQSEAGEVGKG